MLRSYLRSSFLLQRPPEEPDYLSSGLLNLQVWYQALYWVYKDKAPDLGKWVCHAVQGSMRIDNQGGRNYESFCGRNPQQREAGSDFTVDNCTTVSPAGHAGSRIVSIASLYFQCFAPAKTEPS